MKKCCDYIDWNFKAHAIERSTLSTLVVVRLNAWVCLPSVSIV